MAKLIYGFGINDTEGVSSRSKSKKDREIYSVWFNMIQRCYSEKHREKYPSYDRCVVCKEWASLSNFYDWAISKHHIGYELDKDILSGGSLIYSPETCDFIPRSLNKFLIGSRKKQEDGLVGVHFKKRIGKYVAQINNPITKEREHLGVFSLEIDGHIAWAKRKLEIAIMLADHCANKVISEALVKRQEMVLEKALACR